MWDGGWRGLRRVERMAGATEAFGARPARAGFNLREVHRCSVGLLEGHGLFQVLVLSMFASPAVPLTRGHRQKQCFVHPCA